VRTIGAGGRGSVRESAVAPQPASTIAAAIADGNAIAPERLMRLIESSPSTRPLTTARREP